MKRIGVCLVALCVAGGALAQPAASGPVKPDQSDREWKLNLLALQVEERAEAECYGHHLSQEDAKTCFMELRMPRHASRIAAIEGLRPAGMSEDAVERELTSRAAKIFDTLSK